MKYVIRRFSETSIRRFVMFRAGFTTPRVENYCLRAPRAHKNQTAKDTHCGFGSRTPRRRKKFCEGKVCGSPRAVSCLGMCRPDTEWVNGRKECHEKSISKIRRNVFASKILPAKKLRNISNRRKLGEKITRPVITLFFERRFRNPFT